MKTRFTVEEVYEHSVVGTLSMRISAARDMVEINNKTRTHSEYDDVWDVFNRSIHDAMDVYSVNVDFNFEYFLGVSDVIFEIRVFMRHRKGEETKHPICSEQIAGTVLQELFKHFELVGWKTPMLDGYSYMTEELSKLLVFKDK